MTSTDLIRRASVEEICGHRDRALELYARAIESSRQAAQAQALAAPAISHHGIFTIAASSSRGYNSGASLEEIRQRLDRDVWRSVGEQLGLVQLMDAKERKEWEAQVEANPPEATIENITATCFRLLGESDLIFRRGLVNAFSRFCRDYASNDGFKIGPRIVVNYAWTTYSDGKGGRYLGHMHKGDELRDLDRVMHVLDGKAPAALGTEGLLGALHAKDGSLKAETPYWRARWFKNGNLHLYPLREDLRERANRMIAEHFGQAVPAPRGARR